MNAIAQDLAAFARLSPAHQSRLRRKAQAFIAANPGAADHSIWWGCLSARQITYTR
jgi:hypothetical protein